jgi:HK97 family phage portal protein
MSWLKKIFSKTEEKTGPKALVSNLPGLYGYLGEAKELDQKKLLELAESDPDVRTCIDAIVDAVTTNGWVVDSVDEKVAERVKKYILEEWGEDRFWVFLRNLTNVLIIFDEAYLDVTGNIPQIIAPWTMTVRRDNHGNVVGYVQQTAYKIEFSPEEIIHIVLHPVADRAYGSPKLATLRRIIEAKREAETFYWTVFMRKGVLSKAFIMKNVDEATFNRVKNILSETRPGDDLLLSGDIDIKDLGNPVRELEILEMLRDFRQKILAVFRVPPIVYGLEGGINLETSRNQMVNFQQHITSIQRVISASITEAVSRILNLTGFKIKLLEWANPEQQIRIHSIMTQSGIESINEARKALGFQEIDNPLADVPLPFLRLFGENEYGLWDIQETLNQLLTQSARALPEKALLKAKDRDRHDEEVRRLERRLNQGLQDFFRRATKHSDVIHARKELEAGLRALLSSYVYRAALEGIEYVASVASYLPMLDKVKSKIEEIINVCVDDFFHIVSDKLSGLSKPSKPARNYFEIGKQEEVEEEDIYPWQRLDYEDRLNALGVFALWAAFNSAIANSVLEALSTDEYGLKWIAKLNEQACPLCCELHDTYWGPEDIRAGLYKRPPAHPNCRCRLVVVKEGKELWAD